MEWNLAEDDVLFLHLLFRHNSDEDFVVLHGVVHLGLASSLEEVVVDVFLFLAILVKVAVEPVGGKVWFCVIADIPQSLGLLVKIDVGWDNSVLIDSTLDVDEVKAVSDFWKATVMCLACC